MPDTNVGSAPWRRALIASAVGVLTCGWFLSRQYVPIFYVLLAVGACAVSISVAGGARHELRTGNARRRCDWRVDDSGLVLVYISIRTLAIWGGELHQLLCIKSRGAPVRPASAAFTSVAISYAVT